MSNVSFLTPVSCNEPTLPERMGGWADSYLHLSGPIAQACMHKDRTWTADVYDSKIIWWRAALKVISYATLVLPALALIAKIAYRSTHSFRITTWKRADHHFERGEFRNGKLINGVRSFHLPGFSHLDGKVIIASEAFYEPFTDFSDRNRPRLTFVEIELGGSKQLIPVQCTDVEGEYLPYKNCLNWMDGFSPTNAALLTMARDPDCTNDIMGVLNHRKNSVSLSFFLSRTVAKKTGNGDECNYHTIENANILLTLLKKSEGHHIKIDRALIQKWENRGFDELEAHLKNVSVRSIQNRRRGVLLD